VATDRGTIHIRVLDRVRCTLGRPCAAAQPGLYWRLARPPTCDRDVKDLLARIRLRYRYPLILLRAMVGTDFKLRYQASLLGYLWTLLRPLAMFSILYIVFARFLRLGASIPYYPVYLLFGIVIWGFFVEATTQGLTSLVARADLLRKISFPRYVVVLSIGASVVISFALNMVIIVLFMALLRVPVRLEIIWLPLLFLELVALSISSAFFLSALYVRFRDINYTGKCACRRLSTPSPSSTR
jgi:ABC-2 type transport system permease protein